MGDTIDELASARLRVERADNARYFWHLRVMETPADKDIKDKFSAACQEFDDAVEACKQLERKHLPRLGTL